MRDIKDLILKLTGIKDPKEDKDVVVGVIKDVCGAVLDVKSIDFSNDSLKLNVSGVEKNTVFMYQQKILELLKVRLPDRKINRIN